MNKYRNLTASALVKTGSGKIAGIVVNSHTSGTIKVWDNTSAAGAVLFNTITLSVGERTVNLLDANFTTGCYITIGGTADVTVLFD